MDISTLRTFVEVMRHGSFAAVARKRGLLPSSISRTILSLENELGTRLFQRNTRCLIPTEAAELYFERVRDVVGEIDRAQVMVRDVGSTPRGRLRVTSPATWGQTCVVPLLPELTAAFPELSIELLLEDTHRDLLEERIDVAFKLGTLPDSSSVALRLCATSYVACASPRYLEGRATVREPQDITRHSCLVIPTPAPHTRWLFRDEGGSLTEVQVDGRCAVSDDLALHRCAVAGMGVALLPRWLAWRDLQRGDLVALLPQLEATPGEFETSAWLLYPSRTYLPLKARVFVEFLKRRFRDETLPWDVFVGSGVQTALAG